MAFSSEKQHPSSPSSSSSSSSSLSPVYASRPTPAPRIQPTKSKQLPLPWGIVLETLASSGFLFSIALFLGLLLWSLWLCVSFKDQRSSIGGTVFSMSLFLLATAGIFAITFSFIIRHTSQTCPTRLFLFSILFSLAFSCLLARCLALLVRDKKPCEYSQEEFVMMQIYVIGNPELDRRPRWDDPVICIALVANGWVLLMGYGLSQIAFFCRGEAKSKDLPLSFAGWTTPSADIPGLNSPKEGNENGSFESDSETRRGRRTERSLRSPYESGFSMTKLYFINVPICKTLRPEKKKETRTE
ncbi:hypothetical protein F7725_003875 [Dissostichus mawsoni]|uniref:G-protein coupled receptors family 3 profile domain-containing protein n=1 Tax=Dissostichus mawsoni TaxID=36200 RepID=A0A7J5YE25_DISMA|nr:hypothetical protein F7725_003875 [Dissostichus mawsoni]